MALLLSYLFSSRYERAQYFIGYSFCDINWQNNNSSLYNGWQIVKQLFSIGYNSLLQYLQTYGTQTKNESNDRIFILQQINITNRSVA